MDTKTVVTNLQITKYNSKFSFFSKSIYLSGELIYIYIIQTWLLLFTLKVFFFKTVNVYLSKAISYNFRIVYKKNITEKGHE
ncbi:hypothetical protein CER22_31860 [Bacillus sp. K2I17]|nr:hypothetical protein CER22_31860 [Bacillus sp. K2I17]